MTPLNIVKIVDPNKKSRYAFVPALNLSNEPAASCVISVTALRLYIQRAL